MNLCNIKDIKFICNKYKFNLSKSLGQNFMTNLSIITKMVKMSNISSDDGVIEIGPGIGSLTKEIAKKAKKVVSIEIDSKLIPILKETLGEYDNIKIIYEDILKINIRELIAKEFGNMQVRICANLPYYITTPIISSILESRVEIKSITVMVQKEMSERIIAEPGTRNVGAISILVRYFSDPSILFGVSRDNFFPMPEVDSVVLNLNIRKYLNLDIRSEEIFFKVVRSAFAQRRKTIINSISNGMGIDKSLITTLLNNSKIDIIKRAENLTIEEFAIISNMLYFFYSKQE